MLIRDMDSVTPECFNLPDGRQVGGPYFSSGFLLSQE